MAEYDLNDAGLAVLSALGHNAVPAVVAADVVPRETEAPSALLYGRILAAGDAWPLRRLGIRIGLGVGLGVGTLCSGEDGTV